MSVVFYLLTLALPACPRCEGTGTYRRFLCQSGDCALCDGTGVVLPDTVPTDSAKVTIHAQVYESSHFYIRPRDSDCKARVVNRAGPAGAAMLHKAAEGSDWVDVTGWWATDDVFVVEGVTP